LNNLFRGGSVPAAHQTI